jgi:hypothetical protein
VGAVDFDAVETERVRIAGGAAVGSCSVIGGVIGSPVAPATLTPDGPIDSAPGNGPVPGARRMPTCQICGKMRPPASCTAVTTRLQPASASAP